MLTITGISALSDNYIWMLTDTESQTCYIVDPGDAQVVESVCQCNNLTLAGVLLTHHHADHTGGVRQLLQGRSIPVYGPATETIPDVTHPLRDGDVLSLLGTEWQVISTPGHTSGHICYFGKPEGQSPVLFSGDTLFSAGCGRLFEGTAAQMLDSLSRLSELPDETQVYCAHEYTEANLVFAHAVEPDNLALKQRIEEVAALRKSQRPTVPSQLKVEKATNPFLRTNIPSVMTAASRHCGSPVSSNLGSFTIIRQWKDNF